MKTESFVLLLMVISVMFAAVLSHKYVKEQKEAIEMQNKKIETIYEIFGLE